MVETSVFIYSVKACRNLTNYFNKFSAYRADPE